jgi:N-acetylglucosaminyl-diphospho-decaprenol L-rhamnosyltransferase
MNRTRQPDSVSPSSRDGARGGTLSEAMDHRSSAVDVVIVSYNERDRLLACCESALAAGPATRVIVVDNGSSDGSGDAVRACIPSSDLLEMETNLGFGAAVNRGVAVGNAPFVLLLNNDARLRDDSLDLLVSAMQDPRIAAAGPRLLDSSGQVELSMGRTMGPLNEAAFKLLGSLYRDGRGPLGRRVGRYYAKNRWTRSLSAACLLLRREALDRVGVFDERFFLYAEDVDLCRRLRSAGWRLRYVADAVVEHERSVSWRKDPLHVALAYRRSQMAFYRKHHGALAAQTLRAYLTVRFAFGSLLARGERREVARSMLRWTIKEAGRVR